MDRRVPEFKPRAKTSLLEYENRKRKRRPRTLSIYFLGNYLKNRPNHRHLCPRATHLLNRSTIVLAASDTSRNVNIRPAPRQNMLKGRHTRIPKTRAAVHDEIITYYLLSFSLLRNCGQLFVRAGACQRRRTVCIGHRVGRREKRKINHLISCSLPMSLDKTAKRL